MECRSSYVVSFPSGPGHPSARVNQDARQRFSATAALILAGRGAREAVVAFGVLQP